MNAAFELVVRMSDPTHFCIQFRPFPDQICQNLQISLENLNLFLAMMDFEKSDLLHAISVPLNGKLGIFIPIGVW